jgi:hypothetical protein
LIRRLLDGIRSRLAGGDARLDEIDVVARVRFFGCADASQTRRTELFYALVARRPDTGQIHRSFVYPLRCLSLTAALTDHTAT